MSNDDTRFEDTRGAIADFIGRVNDTTGAQVEADAPGDGVKKAEEIIAFYTAGNNGPPLQKRGRRRPRLSQDNPASSLQLDRKTMIDKTHKTVADFVPEKKRKVRIRWGEVPVLAAKGMAYGLWGFFLPYAISHYMDENKALETQLRAAANAMCEANVTGLARPALDAFAKKYPDGQFVLNGAQDVTAANKEVVGILSHYLSIPLYGLAHAKNIGASFRAVAESLSIGTDYVPYYPTVWVPSADNMEGVTRRLASAINIETTTPALKVLCAAYAASPSPLRGMDMAQNLSLQAGRPDYYLQMNGQAAASTHG